jgi:hypothetical protein
MCSSNCSLVIAIKTTVKNTFTMHVHCIVQ